MVTLSPEAQRKRRRHGRDIEGVDREWDAICVGSGVTALAFGAMVAAKDRTAKILILDQHYVAGGYASVFRRRRNRFDCSLHKLTGMGANGNMAGMFRDLGLHRQLNVVRPPEFFEASYPDWTLVIPHDYDQAKDVLARAFPEEGAGLRQFFSEVETHGKNAYYQFQIMDGSYLPDVSQLRYAHRELRRVTVAQALEARVRSPRLRTLLAANVIYVGGFPEEVSYLYYLHVPYAALVVGSAYISGSAQALSNELASRVEDAGGQILLRTEVKRVEVQDNRVCGVDTTRGRFTAPAVFINAAPQYALRTILGGRENLRSVTERALALRPSWSTTTLYLVTDLPPEELGLSSSETMLFSDRAAEASQLRADAMASGSEEQVEDAFWSASQMEVTNYHTLDPAGGRVVCINVLDTISHWSPRDTEDYARKKDRCGAVLLERLYKHKPGLFGHVIESELATPRTYERYTNNDNGAGYGALVGTNGSTHLFHYGFPIAGVQFLNSWVAGPSYEAAFGYARMKATEFVQAREATAKAARLHAAAV
ncbi:MAG: NAD(P)/FAD-dependent oxidoreductase [Polyangiaceae bacterium]|jgi:phytoene dehydrogenase-like protein